MQNSDFRTRKTSLYGSQASPIFLAFKTATLVPELQVSVSQPSSVVLGMQNNVISIRNTSLYTIQPSFVVFVCKTADLRPELQVSMCPRPHQCFFLY